MMPPMGMPMSMPPKPSGPPPPAPVGVIAVVNGQKITISEAQDIAFQISGTQAVGQLIDFALLDQAAKKEGVMVSKAEINSRIDEIRKRIAPESLDQALLERGMTMKMLSDGMYHVIEREDLVGKTIHAAPSRHIRHILVQVAPPGVTPNPTGPNQQHTDADALAIIKKVQADLAAGKSFEDEAKQYSEDPSNKDKGGDLGIVNQTTPFDPAFLKAALDLKKGETTKDPVKSQFGYHIIQCVSTSDDHPAAENGLYNTANDAYIKQQVQFQQNQFMQQLHDKAKITNYLALGSKLTPGPVTAEAPVPVKPAAKPATATASKKPASTAKTTSVVKAH